MLRQYLYALLTAIVVAEETRSNPQPLAVTQEAENVQYKGLNVKALANAYGMQP